MKKRPSRSNTKKKRTPVVKYLFIMLILACTAVALLSLPVWTVKKIVVKGNDMASREKIVRAVSISRSENIFFLDYGEIARRAASVPRVRSAKAYPQVPDSVVIDVTERRPFAVAIIEGEHTVIDDEGVILQVSGTDKGRSYDLASLSTVVGLKRTSVKEGRIADKKVMSAMTSAIKKLTALMNRSKFELEIPGPGELNILVDDVIKVKMGDTGDVDKKLAVLSVILKKIGQKGRKIEYIDLRVPSSPAVKFRP